MTNLSFNMPRRPFEAPTKVRFATYCLLSLGSVAIFQFTPSDDTNCAMQLLWLASPCVAIIVVYMINNLVNKRSTAYMDSCLHPIYTAPISAVLVLLGQLAIWTRAYLTTPPTDIESGTDIQACVIHFAMSFYVLSECEFYRLYWTTHRYDQPLNFRSLFEAFCAADQDPAFEQSRDCFSYHFAVPHLEFPPRDGWFSHDTFMRLIVDMFVFTIPFHVVGMACLSYPIKRLANPDLNDDKLPLAFAMWRAFFSPTNSFSFVLGVKLQRPIRLLNRILFWSIVDCIGRVWKRRETTALR
jgi:hypothetical protein